MDDCLCASIGSVAVSAASVIRGCRGLAAPSAWRFPIGCRGMVFVAGDLIAQWGGRLLAGIPLVFPAGFHL